MSIKKYSSGSWVDIPYRKYGTETDTLTFLPADVIADGQSATASIIGNMVQSGTPSPSSIIMPDECGNKTANLFDKDNYNIVYGYFITGGTTTITADSNNNIVYIPCKPNTTYTVSKILSKRFGIGYTIDEPATGVTVYGAVINYAATSLTVTTDSSAKYLVAYVRNGNVAGDSSLSNIVNSLQINEGSTALPYEPYGYKIPILSGGVTTNWYTSEPLRKLTYIYSGKPETALDAKSNTTENRNICKLELTGQEDWGISGGVFWLGTLTTDYMRKYNSANYICSHYPCYQQTGSAGNVPDMQIAMGYNSAVQRIYLHDSNYTTVQDFQAYLAQQYAAGTPVTLWYVMATGTTVQVAAPSIPTTGTAEQFDVDTTLKPSEVDLTYHGWHEHSDTKFTG